MRVHKSMDIVFYMSTIFLSAFLLFQIQPLIAKFILPWYGGGAGVWTCCMLFFQTMLLAGYAYAHIITSRLTIHKQIILHIILLFISLFFIPLNPSLSKVNYISDNPNLSILFFLTVNIGLPYFILSTTGPLIQQWFSFIKPSNSPYKLYTISNAGSLLGLISYPFFFEVNFSRIQQTYIWSAGLVIYVLQIIICAKPLWSLFRKHNNDLQRKDEKDSDRINFARGSTTKRFYWIILPLLSSIVFLSITNKLSQEITVIPFLWVLPLAIYLITFILCFENKRWYSRYIYISLLITAILTTNYININISNVPIILQIAVYTILLFVACMVIHGELYLLKPDISQLTSYYLFISSGSALGAFLVAIIAPLILTDYLELQFGLWLLTYILATLCFYHRSRIMVYAATIGALACAGLLPWLQSFFYNSEKIWKAYKVFFNEYWPYMGLIIAGLIITTFQIKQQHVKHQWNTRFGWFMISISLSLGTLFMYTWNLSRERSVVSSSRNFFGTLRVIYNPSDDLSKKYNILVHGTTIHGLQFTDTPYDRLPTTYYGYSSGAGLIINEYNELKKKKVGIIGLGTGTLATYFKQEDSINFYEVNEDVINYALHQFTYLKSCMASWRIFKGDARVNLERQPPQQFDILVLDAFSSDAIPVHLLTLEAFGVYKHHLKKEGVILLNISNRYLDLQPIIENLAKHTGFHSLRFLSNMDKASIRTGNKSGEYPATWIALSKNLNLLNRKQLIAKSCHTNSPSINLPLWTDNYSSLFSILK